MRFAQAHPILCANIVFLAAGAGAAVVSELTYRIACVTIVLILRAIWAQTVVRRACKRSAQDTARGIIIDASNYD